MVSVNDIVVFLKERPEYVKTLRNALEHEEQNAGNSSYTGGEWHDVETLGAKLQRLVMNGITKVNFKTRGSTTYLLKDKDVVKKALHKIPQK